MVGSVFTLNILLSVLADAAYALLVGALLAGLWWDVTDELGLSSVGLSSVGLGERWHQPFVLLTGVLLTGVQLARPWFLAAGMSGSTNFHDNLILIPTILSSTHQGALWYWNFGVLLLLFIGVAQMRKSGSLCRITLLASVLALACLKAATGHAADQGDFTLVEGIQAIHILATAVWSGSVLMAGFFVLPRIVLHAEPAAVWRYMSKLSKTATYALIAVLVSGAYTSDRELSNSLAGLGTSMWGRVLLAKIVCVLVAMSLGAYCRFRYLGCEASKSGVRRVLLLLRWEAMMMAAILLLSGLLGNSAPPMSNL